MNLQLPLQKSAPLAPKLRHQSPRGWFSDALASAWRGRTLVIAALCAVAIALHLALRFGWRADELTANIPLWVALGLGGAPLIWELLGKVWAREFGADLLAGISIVTSIILGEYLAGTIVVLMLSGGEALESYALANTSSVLAALAKRMPSLAHRQTPDGVEEIALDAIQVGDILVLHPHDICPADGIVTEGHGAMNEAFLTGEPFAIIKTVGAAVISGAINGDAVLSVRATKLARDSRQLTSSCTSAAA